MSAVIYHWCINLKENHRKFNFISSLSKAFILWSAMWSQREGKTPHPSPPYQLAVVLLTSVCAVSTIWRPGTEAIFKLKFQVHQTNHQVLNSTFSKIPSKPSPLIRKHERPLCLCLERSHVNKEGWVIDGVQNFVFQTPNVWPDWMMFAGVLSHGDMNLVYSCNFWGSGWDPVV